jgi:hypothetical protein
MRRERHPVLEETVKQFDGDAKVIQTVSPCDARVPPPESLTLKGALETLTDQYSLARAADRFEIQNKLYLICRAIDRRDVGSARAAYHSDAVDHHGTYQGDIDGFLAWVQERHRFIEYSWHGLSNIYIEFASSDKAFSESYVLTLQSAAPDSAPRAQLTEEPEILVVGRYVDSWSRRDGVWGIEQRQTLPERTFMIPGGARETIPRDPQFLQWTRDKADPAEQLLKELGLRAESER